MGLKPVARTARYSDAEKALFLAAGWEVYTGHEYADEVFYEDKRTGCTAYVEDPRKLDWTIVPGQEECEEAIEDGCASSVVDLLVQVKQEFETLPAKDDICWLET